MPAVSMAYLLVMHYDVQYTKYFNLNAEFILVSHAFWFRLHKSFIELFFFCWPTCISVNRGNLTNEYWSWKSLLVSCYVS